MVDGDVYLVGGGDPVLSEQWYTEPPAHPEAPADPRHQRRGAGRRARAAGVTLITGQVLGDGTATTTNATRRAGAIDQRASIDGVPVGALVVNDSISQSGGIASDPAKSAAQTFRRLLRDRGIAVAATAAPAPRPPTRRAGDGHLAAAVRHRQRDAGHQRQPDRRDAGEGDRRRQSRSKGTRGRGLQAIGARFVEWGVPAEQFVLADGSGLSRENRLTCDGLLRVLQRGSSTDVVGTGLARPDRTGPPWTASSSRRV